RQDWDKIAKALKPVYTAPNEAAAAERFGEFQDAWGKKYPAVIRLWEVGFILPVLSRSWCSLAA
ncbi:transposase, partial [Streptomyces sp. NPDC005548]|uniref:transposase n=1 Tax=Streptomyces sp. NPDC005548 TaxID=3364724 RepID=UPI00368C3101